MTTQVESPSKTLERVNAYSEFQRGEGIPVVRGFAIEDLKTLELGDWARKGGRGASVNDRQRAVQMASIAMDLRLSRYFYRVTLP